MNPLMALLSLLLTLAAADEVPARLRLDEPRQDYERERQQPRASESQPPMEWLYTNSRLEAGLLWTDFDDDLEIETDLAAYVRWDVSVNPVFSVNVTYRHYSFDSSEIPGDVEEHLLIRGLFAGVGAHLPFATSFFLSLNASAGVMRWESNLHQFSDDTGPVLSGEAALGVRLTEMLRLKAGLGLDAASTDFKANSTETLVSLNYLVGVELGF